MMEFSRFFPSTRWLSILSLFFLILASSAPVQAQWCGENGLIRFSLVPGDSIVSTVNLEPENGVTMVDVYAWLTDVVPVAGDGEAFLATGGFEFTLVVEGAEAFITEKTVPIHHLDMGKTTASCIVGLDPGLTIFRGRAMLVQWKVMFQGKPEDVVFRLDHETGHSCSTVPGCEECGSPALYIGVEGSHQLTTFFGAGYEPAFLNPTGETDSTPFHGTCSFEDIGLFERR